MALTAAAAYHLSPLLSDVAIRIVRSDLPGQSLLEELPGHGIVLAAASEQWRGAIEAARGGRTGVTLQLAGPEPMRLAAARELVRYVYKSELPSSGSGAEQALLVHVLSLAHAHGVRACAAACVDALLGADALHLDAIHTVYALLSPEAHEGGAVSQLLAPLLEHCADQLQAQLGDLDATLGNHELLTALSTLPDAGAAAVTQRRGEELLSQFLH